MKSWATNHCPLQGVLLSSRRRFTRFFYNEIRFSRSCSYVAFAYTFVASKSHGGEPLTTETRKRKRCGVAKSSDCQRASLWSQTAQPKLPEQHASLAPTKVFKIAPTGGLRPCTTTAAAVETRLGEPAFNMNQFAVLSHFK